MSGAALTHPGRHLLAATTLWKKRSALNAGLLGLNRSAWTQRLVVLTEHALFWFEPAHPGERLAIQHGRVALRDIVSVRSAEVDEAEQQPGPASLADIERHGPRFTLEIRSCGSEALLLLGATDSSLIERWRSALTTQHALAQPRGGPTSPASRPPPAARSSPAPGLEQLLAEGNPLLHLELTGIRAVGYLEKASEPATVPLAQVAGSLGEAFGGPGPKPAEPRWKQRLLVLTETHLLIYKELFKPDGAAVHPFLFGKELARLPLDRVVLSYKTVDALGPRGSQYVHITLLSRQLAPAATAPHASGLTQRGLTQRGLAHKLSKLFERASDRFKVRTRPERRPPPRPPLGL